MSDGVSMPRANFREGVPSGEREIARENCALLTHELILSLKDDDVVIRIFGSRKDGTEIYIGLAPERALKLGEAFIRAALRGRPSLRPVPEATAGREDGR